MKVAHVITRMIIGGAQENTLFTVQGLREYEEYSRVDLVTGPSLGPEGSLVDLKGLKEGKDFILIPSLVRNIHPVKDMIALFRLWRLFVKEKYDVVHTHSSKAGIVGRLAAKMAGVKIIVHTIHGLPFHDYQSKILNGIYIALEKLGAVFSTKIVTVCHVMTEKALAKGVGRREQFVTIYSGMDLQAFLDAGKLREDMRKKLKLSDDCVVIGKVARLFHLKGHDFLFDSISEVKKLYPNIRVLLVGDGLLKQDLEKKAAALGIQDELIFAGLVEPKEIPAYVSAMDILVHVSLREGLARVLPQAMASEIPVVSFDIDGAREVVENGENGYLTEPGDVSMLTDALLSLLKDKDFRKRLGHYGRAKVDPLFRKEYMVRKINDLYMELTQNGTNFR